MYSLSPVKFGGGVSMVTTSLGPNDPKVGDVCVDGNEVYRFVYNASADAHILAGLACTVTGVSGYTVNLTTTTSADILIGVVKHATISTLGYGWVVEKGFCQITAIASSGTITKGSLGELGASGKFGPKSNTTANGNYVVKAMEDIVSSGSGTAYIQCG